MNLSIGRILWRGGIIVKGLLSFSAGLTKRIARNVPVIQSFYSGYSVLTSSADLYIVSQSLNVRLARMGMD
jgi:hypothetical protein